MMLAGKTIKSLLWQQK